MRPEQSLPLVRQINAFITRDYIQGNPEFTQNARFDEPSSRRQTLQQFVYVHVVVTNS